MPTQGFDCTQTGCGAAFHPNLLEDAAEVLFHGFPAQAENGGDVPIVLALGDPEQDFRFPRDDREGIDEGLVGREIGMESALRRGGVELPFMGPGAGEPYLNCGKQLIPHHGFCQVVIGSEIHPHPDIAAGAAGGEENEGNGGERGFAAQGLHDAVAVHYRHQDVAENQVREVQTGLLKAGASVFRREDLVSFQFEEEGDIELQARKLEWWRPTTPPSAGLCWRCWQGSWEMISTLKSGRREPRGMAPWPP